MKLVYVVKEATYQKLITQLESLDRALCNLSLKEADARSGSLRKALAELGIDPIELTDACEQVLRERGARELLARTHLNAGEARRLRGYLDEDGGDLVKKVDSRSAPHLIILEP